VIPARRSAALLALLLALATFGLFARSGGNEFVDFDDGLYIGANPVVRNGLTPAGLGWAFGSVGYASNWHPVTWISHMLDVSLFGLDPMAHHLVGAAIHALSTALLFVTLAWSTGWTGGALGTSALFGLHPLRVESVAWAAERKDLLSVFFVLAAIAAYRWYLDRPSAGRYSAIVAATALSLLSKPTGVTLPLLLLALDFWPLGRWREGRPGAARLVLEKAPLGIIGLPVVYLTFRAQGAGEALRTLTPPPLIERAGDAALAAGTYLAQTFWPAGLSVYYPRSGRAPWLPALGAAALLGITAAVGFASRRRPAGLAGWAFFVAALLPVCGIVRFGLQGHADRYTYLPHVGLFMALVFGLAGASPGGSARRRVLACVAVLAVVSAGLTWRQLAVWRDTGTLFRHALEATGENWMASFSLGNVALREGRLDDAVGHLREAARLNAHNVGILSNLAYALSRSGRRAEAVALLQRALSLDPGNAILGANLERLRGSGGGP
jgi:hypothetical protein